MRISFHLSTRKTSPLYSSTLFLHRSEEKKMIPEFEPTVRHFIILVERETIINSVDIFLLRGHFPFYI